MLNKFLKNISVIVLLNLLVKPFWVLFVDRLVQEQVGNTAFGMFQTFTSFTLICGLILDPGLKTYFQTKLSSYRPFYEEKAGQMILLKLILAFLFFLVIAALAFGVEEYRANWPLFLILAGNQILLSFLLFSRATLVGLDYYQREILMTVVDKLVMISICLPIFFTTYFPNWQTVEAFALAHSCGYGVAILVCLLFLKDHWSQVTWKISSLAWKTTLKESMPFAFFTGLMTLYIYADFIMIQRLLPSGFENAGLYRKAYRFLEAASMFALLFGNLLLPMFGHIIHNRLEVIKLLKGTFKCFVLPASVISMIGFSYRAEWMNLVYPHEISVVADCFGILMLDFFAISLFYVFGTVLTASQELRTLNKIAGIGVLVNIALNFYLLPRVGIKGAAISTLVTHTSVGLLQMRYSLVKYNIKPKLGVMVRVIAFLGVNLVGFISFQFLDFNWLIELLFLSALSFTFALIFKVFSFKGLIVLVKNA